MDAVLRESGFTERAPTADLRLAVLQGETPVPRRIARLLDELVELIPGDLELAHRETLRNFHRVPRSFIVGSLRLVVGRAHRVLAAWHDDHLGAVRALPEFVLLHKIELVLVRERHAFCE